MKFNFFGLFDNNEATDNTQIENKQKNIKLLIFGSIALFFIFFVIFSDSEKEKRELSVGKFNIVKEDEAVKTKWIKSAETDLGTQQRELKKAKDEIILLKKAIRDLQENNKNINFKIKNNSYIKPTNNVKNVQKYPTPPKSSNFNLDKYLPDGYKSKNVKKDVPKNVDFSKSNSHKQKIITQKTQMQSSLDVVVFNNLDNNSTNDGEDKNNIQNKPLNIIPTGTIISATLVNGMDAPTMSQAKDNPLIAHMVITDLGVLPNEYRYDVKKCFVLGEGYGDLSSERVYIRVNNISCITENGDHIDLPLKGYVAGEDGKIGMQGEVVYKQGAILARTLVAGFVSGVAEGFESVGNNIKITDSGVLNANEGKITTKKMLQKGAYKGVSKGADKLVDFYLKLADQVFPVIEIQAGRKVDIVVTQYRKIVTLEKQSDRK